VSCESYGRRWKLGDTVGVLVDMDLLEMRFYLNGEDLGAAFEDFSAYELHPAFSLNVRQCIRINFGQYKFLHPPNEVDGKPFKPVVSALLSKYQQLQQINAPPKMTISPKATLSPKKSGNIAMPTFSATRHDDSPQHPSQNNVGVVSTTVGDVTSRQQQQQQQHMINRMQRPASSSLSRPRNITSASAMRPSAIAIGMENAGSSSAAIVGDIVAPSATEAPLAANTTESSNGSQRSGVSETLPVVGEMESTKIEIITAVKDSELYNLNTDTSNENNKIEESDSAGDGSFSPVRL